MSQAPAHMTVRRKKYVHVPKSIDRTFSTKQHVTSFDSLPTRRASNIGSVFTSGLFLIRIKTLYLRHFTGARSLDAKNYSAMLLKKTGLLVGCLGRHVVSFHSFHGGANERLPNRA